MHTTTGNLDMTCELGNGANNNKLLISIHMQIVCMCIHLYVFVWVCMHVAVLVLVYVVCCFSQSTICKEKRRVKGSDWSFKLAAPCTFLENVTRHMTSHAWVWLNIRYNPAHSQYISLQYAKDTTREKVFSRWKLLLLFFCINQHDC